MSEEVLHHSDYRGKPDGSRQGQEFKPFPRRAWIVIRVLPELCGKPWDDLALGYVHALRPSQLRVVKDFMQLDSQTWRVTVCLKDDDVTIDRIEQEVEVGSPEGCTTGSSIQAALEHGIESSIVKWHNIPGSYFYGREVYKTDREGVVHPYPEKIMTPPTTTIWTATNGLRLVMREVPGRSVHGKSYVYTTMEIREVLQQQFLCQETGETEWRDVPVEEER